MLTTLAALVLLARHDGMGRIAFVSDRDGNDEIYVMDADGANVKRLTFSPGKDEQPCFSPDGQQIAFISNRSGNPDLWVMSADGSNQRNLTETKDAADSNPTWIEEPKGIMYLAGRTVYLADPDNDTNTLFLSLPYPPECQITVSRTGGKFASQATNGRLLIKDLYEPPQAVPMTYGANGVPAKIFNPSWASDSVDIAFDSGGTQPDIFIYDFEDTTCEKVIMEGHGSEPCFAKGNDSIVFTMSQGEGKGTDIGIIEIEAVHKVHGTPKPTNLTHLTGNDKQPCYWEDSPGG